MDEKPPDHAVERGVIEAFVSGFVTLIAFGTIVAVLAGNPLVTVLAGLIEALPLFALLGLGALLWLKHRY